jgi:hypothetical protein
MFGQFKPVAFEPYGRRRSRVHVPRWLVLLLAGTAVGVGGVIYLQERYLPPRLSADASARLTASYEEANSERLRLRTELADTAKQLQAAVAERKALADELVASRDSVQGLREDVAALAASLPPDPRGGAVQVRAARFTTEGAKLVYNVVLSRERAGSKPLAGVMQFVVAGSAGRGPETSIKLAPVTVTVGSVESVRGGIALPEGFDARQATVTVLDRRDGKLLGMRVMNVK